MTAYRLDAHCPQCGNPLVVRRRNRDNAEFLGCSNYPSCRFTSPFSPALQALGAENAALRQRLAAHPTPAPSANIDAVLRQLLAIVHPDKWRDSAVATELTKHINDLRRRLMRGQGVRS